MPTQRERATIQLLIGMLGVDEPLQLVAIAEKTDLSLRTVTVRIRELAAGGYVKELTGGRWRRQYSLTETGRQRAVLHLATVSEAVDSYVVKRMSIRAVAEMAGWSYGKTRGILAREGVSFRQHGGDRGQG